MAKTTTAKKTRQEMEIPNDLDINEVTQVDFENVTSEQAQKSKALAAEGIDLITKGTNFKARAELMMNEGKVAMNKAEELFSLANDLDGQSKDHASQNNTEVEDVKKLSSEREQTRKTLLQLDRDIKKTKDSSEKNERLANTYHEDSKDKFEQAERLKIEANKLFAEASKYSDEGNKMVEEGNGSIEKSQSVSNDTLKKVAQFSEEDFTREIKINLTTQEMQAVKVADAPVAEDTKSKGIFSKK